MISFARIKSFCVGDMSIYKKVLETYLVSTENDLQLLTEAISKNETKTMKAIAHKINGFALMIDAASFSEILSSIENNGISSEQQVQAAVVESLNNEWQLIIFQLKNELNQIES
jgi:HPt (histidine-containing phosphotransfer) domain-containing protein